MFCSGCSKQILHQISRERRGVPRRRKTKVFSFVDALMLIVNPLDLFVTLRSLPRGCLVIHVRTNFAFLLFAAFTWLTQPNHRHAWIARFVHARDSAHKHRIWIVGRRNKYGHRLVHHKNWHNCLQNECFWCKLSFVDQQDPLVETTNTLGKGGG